MSSFQEKTREFIDPVYGYDYEVTGYFLAATPLPHDRAQAVALIDQALAAAPGPVIRNALARLRVATKSRAEESDDITMRMQVLAEECSRFPADVVQAACLRWSRKNVFFPALAELLEIMESLVKHRQQVSEAIHRRSAHE